MQEVPFRKIIFLFSKLFAHYLAIINTFPLSFSGVPLLALSPPGPEPKNQDLNSKPAASPPGPGRRPGR
jgi:hypothetical protein